MKAGVISSELRIETKNTKGARGMNELEQDLFTLNAIAPALLEHIPGLFEEAVRESLGNMLGMKETTGVLSWFRDAEVASRPEVFARLASRYGDRASPLLEMIDEAFRRRVRGLLEMTVAPTTR